MAGINYLPFLFCFLMFGIMALYRRPSPRRIVMNKAVAAYHCFCRTAGQSFLFDDEAKRVFVEMLNAVAAFSGVEVLTYCVMTNHFHLLVRINPKAAEVNDVELVRRFHRLYGSRRCPYLQLDAEGVEAKLAHKDAADADELRAHLRSRMGTLAPFMKTLKQRFSVWFNATHERAGTLWAERYQSVLVENEPAVLRLVGAYIDLNPVRAHLVEDAAAYRWSGAGAAFSGDARARQRLLRMLGPSSILNSTPPKQEALIQSYKRLLQAIGAPEAPLSSSSEGRAKPPSSASHFLDAIIRGAIIGTRDFVERCADTTRRSRRSWPLHKDKHDNELALHQLRRPRRRPKAPSLF